MGTCWYGPSVDESGGSSYSSDPLESGPFPPPDEPSNPVPDFEDLFIEKLYDWVELTRAPSPQFRGESTHVSSIEKHCSRKVVFREYFPELVTPDEIPAHLQMIFDFGTSVHDWWQNHYFGAMGWLWGNWRCIRCRYIEKKSFKPKDPCPNCGWNKGPNEKTTLCKDTCRWPGGYDKEGRNCNLCNRWGEWKYLEPHVWDPKLDITGHCDGIIIPPEESELGLSKFALEMKTINKSRFDKLVRPIRKHVFQINIYMHYLKLDYGVILYIHKGEYDQSKGNQPRCFLIKYDPSIADEAVRRRKEWMETEEDLNLRRRICPGIDSWKAKSCDFHSVCYDRNIEDKINEIKQESESTK